MEAFIFFRSVDGWASRKLSRWLPTNSVLDLAGPITLVFLAVVLTPTSTLVAQSPFVSLVFFGGSLWGWKPSSYRGLLAVRAWLGVSALFRLCLIVVVTPFLMAFDATEGWFRWVGWALPFQFAVTLALHWIAPLLREEWLKSPKPPKENPRSEYERLGREAMENDRRRRELERDNPDFNRP